MNKIALRGFGAAALLIVGLTACGGPAVSNEAASVPVSETATTTPTPSPTPAKQYTSEELTAIALQLRDANGLKLSVMSMADASGVEQQSRAMFEGAVIEPAACKELMLASLLPTDNVKGVVGTSLDTSTGTSTGVTLSSGLDEEFIQADFAKQDQISDCAGMTMTMGETTVTLRARKIEATVSTPLSMALRTDSVLADGRTQSTILVRGAKDGVVITGLAYGGKTEAEAIARAVDLVNQAAALIK
ncbi:hypothetical protein ACIQH5_09735 [Paenarthrobacter sp. NPDC091711]|uniref:hypothetical protein n=1 Tax=Paenarthrobacter sp. NPDC091711 TaxID=3364385 RepID=UPI00380FC1AF